ncbi:ankyrin repeat-containing domain protein [Tuber borchii]|uniref:Ankyrin repeat-containing domain protein n=1 Tax=Tuber borchii TaxID=42251 RepID=A0A2T7A2I5_TUBBO|nr:ankyrin repeat-containing domain protein [Tuber borchii]
MNFIRLPAELQLLVAEGLEPRGLSYLSRTSRYFHSLCTPVLERGAQEPIKSHCALEWAILRNKLPLAQLLLSKGHDINNMGSIYSGTALHVAVISGNYSLIPLFLENPALDLNKLDGDEDTALHRAIWWGNPEGVELLHAAGADLEIPDKRGRTALLLAILYCDMRIIEFLVRNGANVNARLPAGTWLLDVTPLHGLMWPNCERLVRLALEYGADPEIRDHWHQRPIDIAFMNGLTGIVEILREVSLPLDIDVESDLETVWSDSSSGLRGINMRGQ